MDIRTIGVVGAGQMGGGIAHVAALAGFDVVLADVSRELVEKGLATITRNLDRQVSKGTVTAEAKGAALGRIRGEVGLAGLAGCEFGVEAIVEDLAVKTGVLVELDRLLAPGAILATNTSSISITALGGVDVAPRQVHRDAFHEPGAGHEARRDDPRARDERRDDRRDRSI